MTLNFWLYASVHGFYLLEIIHMIYNNYARSLFIPLDQWEITVNNEVKSDIIC